MIKNTEGTRFRDMSRTNEGGVKRNDEKAKKIGNQKAPTKMNFDIPDNVTKLGIGTMLKLKFSALKEAITHKDSSPYGSLKSEAKNLIRAERLNRKEANETPKLELGGFTQKKEKLLDNLRSENFATFSRQIGAMVDQSTVDGKFDPAIFQRQTREVLKGLTHSNYESITKEFLQKAMKNFDETKDFDPHRGLRKEATNILLLELSRLAKPEVAREMFLDMAKEKVRNGDEKTFLRGTAVAAPLLFIARTHGAKELGEDVRKLGLELKQDVHRLNEAMLKRRKDEGDTSYLTSKSSSIDKYEASDLVSVTLETIGKLGSVEPKLELKLFLAEMVNEIRLAHPDDPKGAATLINRLYCDQIFLRTIVGELATSQSMEGEKSNAGTLVSDIIQITANGMTGGIEKLGSEDFRKVMTENSDALLKAINDLLVKQFGMPEDAHINYKPPRPERPAPRLPPNPTLPIDTGPIRQQEETGSPPNSVDTKPLPTPIETGPVLKPMDKTDDTPGEIDESVVVVLDDDIHDMEMDRLEEKIRKEIEKKN